MDEFFGKKYVMVGEENFDVLLLFLEKNYVERRLAMTLKPVQHVTDNGDGTFSIYFHCFLVTYRVVFTPGEEFDEVKPDGVKVRTVITIEGNKIRHIQTDKKGRVLNHIYEFFPDQMTITTTSEHLKKVVKRYYKSVD